jgi:hypothetical protein
MKKQLKPRLTKCDISFENMEEIKYILQFILPDWVDEACSGSKSIGIYLYENYKDLDLSFVDNGIRPFIIIIPERKDNYVPIIGAKKTHVIEIGSNTNNHLVVGTIKEVISNMILNKKFIEKQKSKFKEAYGHLWQLGQGDGMFDVLRIQTENDYYSQFLAISLNYFCTPA